MVKRCRAHHCLTSETERQGGVVIPMLRMSKQRPAREPLPHGPCPGQRTASRDPPEALSPPEAYSLTDAASSPPPSPEAQGTTSNSLTRLGARETL